MASIAERLPENAPGRYYVDSTCIDCDQCREAAPTLFSRNADTCHSYVQRQPATPHDQTLIAEVLASCPAQAIGEDGT